MYPCPPGTFNPSSGGTNTTSCLPCSAGSSCSQFSLIEPDGGCDPGHYCRLGSIHSSPIAEDWGDLCPIGHMCPPNTSFPLICPEGMYVNSTGASECNLCPSGSFCINGSLIFPCEPGYYCPAGTGLSWQPCPTGTYNPLHNVGSVDGCLSCPPGRYCQGTGIEQFDGVTSGFCSAGFYCLEGVNTSMPVNPYFTGVGGECPPGYYCEAGTSIPEPCPLGTFSNQSRLTSVSECTPCLAGMFCASINLTTPSGVCSPGYVCSGGASRPDPIGDDVTGYPCLPGHYCPTGSSLPLPCLSGQYNPLHAQEECFLCPPGFYCLEGSVTFNLTRCPAGYYCSPGTQHQYENPCPAGTYGVQTGLQDVSECTECDPGYFCIGGRSSPDGLCSAGWYCSHGADSPTPETTNGTNSSGGLCDPGFYCSVGSGKPLPCPKGMFCGECGLSVPSGPCSAGYYCFSGASVPNPTDGLTGYPCPCGQYCEAGVTEPANCPPGTYLNSTGASMLADCIPCTAGFYCASSGLSFPSGPCQAGYYCPEGSVVPSDEQYICTPGHYCPEGSEQEMLCEGGSYSDTFAAAACTICPERFFCPFSLNVPLFDFYDCPFGYYCPPGTSSGNQFGCPRGTYSTLPNRASESECLPCRRGRYCGVPGLNSSDGSGPCSSGYFCIEQASTSTPTDGITGNICASGHYCPEGTIDQIPCPIGTYLPNSGGESASDCLGCTSGFYCAVTGLSEPSGECEAGYYCSGNSTLPTPVDGIVGDTCDAGHFCPQGSNRPIPCPPGTFSSQPLASQCDSCPAGHFCIDGLEPEECLPGYYCPIGTGFNLLPCPPGTYSNQYGLSRLDQCTECSPGFYCAEFAAINETGVCEAGFFCSLGSNTPAPNGINSTGNSGPCPKGHFCLLNSRIPQPCPKGTYSNQTHLVNSSQCCPCPQGHYCGSSGLTNPSGLCSAGHYCSLGSTSATPNAVDETGGICPRGHFCPEGSSYPIPCESGSHNPDFGQEQCFPCLAGYYCPENTTDPFLVCPVGHYCPESTRYDREYPCPAGTYNDQLQRRDISDCKRCPPGQYCEGFGLEFPSGLCDGGWYCVSSSPSSTPDNSTYGGKCRPGFYCPEGSVNPISCLAGYYCSDSALSSVSGPCHPGYYCIEGALSPRPEDSITGDICPCGHYCPEGSPFPVACPEGHYSNTTGNQNLTMCEPCDKGSYCSSQGLCETSGFCSAGHYCPQGQSSSRPSAFLCPPGFHCPFGSFQPTSCEPGYFQDAFGESICKSCPEGYYCNGSSSSGTIVPNPCQPGRYCPSETRHVNEYLCPVGTYSSTMLLVNISQCALCTPGHYCDSEGLTLPAGPCDSGYYCISGAVIPQPSDGITGNQCSPGTYCPSGSSHPILCPVGTFNQLTGGQDRSYCISCTPGYFCDNIGAQNVSGLCDSGFYCSGGASTPTPLDLITGYFCPKGHYCESGSSTPIPCRDGEYSNVTHSTSCSVCPSGFYCPGNATITPESCPPGHFCEDGISIPSPCPMGTFNPDFRLSSESECLICLSGPCG